MSIAAAANLETATRDLFIAWRRTEESWRDQKSRQFEKNHLDSLPDLVAGAKDALSQMEGILRKIKNDCE